MFMQFVRGLKKSERLSYERIEVYVDVTIHVYVSVRVCMCVYKGEKIGECT